MYTQEVFDMNSLKVLATVVINRMHVFEYYNK